MDPAYLPSCFLPWPVSLSLSLQLVRLSLDGQKIVRVYIILFIFQRNVTGTELSSQVGRGESSVMQHRNSVAIQSTINLSYFFLMTSHWYSTQFVIKEIMS